MLGISGLAAGLVLAGVFAFSGLAKLVDREGTRTAVDEFGVPTRLIGFLALALPLTELVVAILLLPSATRVVGAAGSLALLGVFSAVVGMSLVRGQAPECHCFGTLRSEPASWKTLVRNSLFMVFAALVLAAGVSHQTPSTVGWMRGIGSAQLVALAGAVLVLAGSALGLRAFSR